MSDGDKTGDGTGQEMIPADEVDDVIEIASDIAQREEQEEDAVSRSEMVDIGEQLGLESEHVEEAIDELDDREEEATRRAAKRKRIAVWSGAVAGGIVVLALIFGMVGRSGLKSARLAVDKQRAQVRNVLDRQSKVQARLAGQPLNDDRDAELAGSENRVSIEKRRYDKAATDYNDIAGSFPGSWGATLFGLDKRVPLSNEVDEW